MACSKTIILKTYPQKTKVKVHVFKVHLFVASMSEALSLCVFDYYRKTKEKSRSL